MWTGRVKACQTSIGGSATTVSMRSDSWSGEGSMREAWAYPGPYATPKISRTDAPKSAGSLPDDLDQHPLRAPSVELAVEDLLPGSEIQLPAGDRDHDLAPHDLALVVGVGVVLAGAIVPVAFGARIVRGQLLEPALVVLMEPRLVVVDEHARGDVHRVHQAEPLAHAALPHGFLHLVGDVHEVHARRDLEGEG